MARVSTYLNFNRETEEAFNFYKSVFGTEFIGSIDRMGDEPAVEGQQTLSEEDNNLVMNIQLPIYGGHVIMGTDSPESIGLKLIKDNNVYINIEPDTKEEVH